LRLNIYLLGALLFLTVHGVNGQDLHYSQFFNSQMNINPALTGIFNGDVRFTGHYRNQWPSVPVDYTTVSAAADMKFLRPNSNNFFSGGVLLNYDQAGDSQLRFAQIGLGGSYSMEVAANNFITLGAMLGIADRRFSLTNLTFDAQYTGGQFDPSLPINEFFDRTGVTIFDVSLGGNYRWQKTSRTKLDLGLGVFHINKPKHPFYDEDDIRLPIRLGIHALAQFQVGDHFDLMARALYQNQSPYQETVLGLGGLFYINQNRGKEFGLELGVHYRLNDAIVPMVLLHWRALTVGYSHDINTSPFKVATNNNGGPELTLSYIITKVKPLSKYKVCPLF